MPKSVSGIVVEGDHRGRALGFPTANVIPSGTDAQLDEGVFAGHVIRESGAKYAAAISVGSRPTYYGEEASVVVEAHLLDFDDDLYGERITIIVGTFLRAQERFPTDAALRDQIDADVTSTRAWAKAQIDEAE